MFIKTQNYLVICTSCCPSNLSKFSPPWTNFARSIVKHSTFLCNLSFLAFKPQEEECAFFFKASISDFKTPFFLLSRYCFLSFFQKKIAYFDRINFELTKNVHQMLQVIPHKIEVCIFVILLLIFFHSKQLILMDEHVNVGLPYLFISSMDVFKHFTHLLCCLVSCLPL